MMMRVIKEKVMMMKRTLTRDLNDGIELISQPVFMLIGGGQWWDNSS